MNYAVTYTVQHALEHQYTVLPHALGVDQCYLVHRIGVPVLSGQCGHEREREKKRNRSDITPDPGGHRPQHPCAQGRTRAKQDQAQASAPGQNRTRSAGGATTHGRRTRQASESVPT